MTAERTRSLYAFVFVASLIGWLYFIWARVPSDAEEWEHFHPTPTASYHRCEPAYNPDHVSLLVWGQKGCPKGWQQP